MSLRLFERADCSSGTQYYTCAANSFSGCCSVDACDYTDGCPDSSVVSSTTTYTVQPTFTVTAIASATTSASSTSSTTSNASFTSASAIKGTSTTSGISTSTSLGTSSTSLGVSSTFDTSSSSSTSTTSSSSMSNATGAANTTSSVGTSNTHSGLSKGSIAGITIASMLAYVLVAAFLIWRRCGPQRKRSTAGRLEELEEHEKMGNNSSRMASPDVSSPTDGGTVSLFGEATGGLEAALARWGLHGARLAALRERQRTGSLRSRGDVTDLGSYLGPIAETPGKAVQTTSRLVELELDASGPAVVSELESPSVGRPAVLPQLSPALSASTGIGSPATTFVSSWRTSATGSTSAILGPGAVTPELDGTLRMETTSALPGQVAPSRTTVDVTAREGRNSQHIGSWASY